MSDSKPTAMLRLTQIKDFLTMNKTATTIPWDPNSTKFPTRKELPVIPGAPANAAWVWGEEDYIGRLNLLTPTRVKTAAKEIRTGEIVCVNLPLNEPDPPSFGRETFKHEVKVITEGRAYDDLYHLNTQSGTQWDGFRHMAHMPSSTFYNNTKGEDITGPKSNLKCSIHHWAEHGIAGRGVLLDYRSYAEEKGIHYDPFDSHAITYTELVACGAYQGIDIRPASQGGHIQIGDILFVRSGFVQEHRRKTPEERSQIAARVRRDVKFAGVAQEESVLDWLHDCYFAAVAGDAPAFERWPTAERYFLHESILALWGMPLGEMLDLEKLAAKCKERRNWMFFFTSAPANVKGGVSSHVNGQAIL